MLRIVIKKNESMIMCHKKKWKKCRGPKLVCQCSVQYTLQKISVVMCKSGRAPPLGPWRWRVVIRRECESQSTISNPMINNIVVRVCYTWKQHINLHIPNTFSISLYLHLFCFNITEAIRTNYRLKFVSIFFGIFCRVQILQTRLGARHAFLFWLGFALNLQNITKFIELHKNCISSNKN